MRIAVLVKQVPAFTEMELDEHRRLIRAGLPLELNPYCRRAVSQAVELAGAGRGGRAPGSVTVVTLGPPSAEDALREAIAWALERGVEADGLLVTDPAFAGSDTLATARALAAALEFAGPFDLVLAGRNSVDSETGQVPPQLAELLGLPFLTGVRELEVEGPGGSGDGVPGRLTVRARCEHDDGWVDAEVDLPALLSCAERLIEPAKVDAAGRAAVPAGRIRRVAAGDLGAGPWGQPGSPTAVGAVRVHEVNRECVVLDGPVEEQVRAAVDVLLRRGALAGAGSDPGRTGGRDLVGAVPRPGNPAGPPVAVVLESDRPHVTQELLSAAAELAEDLDGHVVAFADWPDAGTDVPRLGAWGADEVVVLVPAGPPETSESEPAFLTAAMAPSGTRVGEPAGAPVGEPAGAPVGEPAGALGPEDVAAAVAEWAQQAQPWAVLAPSTAWGREVAGRAAARLGAGLTGDAVGFDVDWGASPASPEANWGASPASPEANWGASPASPEANWGASPASPEADWGASPVSPEAADRRLVAWKPAFGGQVLAAITASSPVQMATVRPGILPRREPREDGAVLRRVTVVPRSRVRVLSRARDDDTTTLAEAAVVVGVGGGIVPEEYGQLQGLLDVLGAELGATRKVTDRGWLPHARQIGITGRSIAPNLYLAVALSGKFNHMVGVRSAGTILAINPDPGAPVFAAADVGITADWRDAVPALVAELLSRL